MQVVVEIDDNLYTRLFDNGVDNYDDAVEMAKAIRKGIPLPEGHGNIIDVNSIKEISLSNITYHMVWQPKNDTELKCRIEAPILVKSDAISEITVRTESEN